MRICLSSGHGLKIRGASGKSCGSYGLDEVDEARKVVEHVADYLHNLAVHVMTYHDDVSTTQNENLNRIVDWHNSQTRDRDASVHFNAYSCTSKPMGCEVLYVSQQELARRVSVAIADAGDFIDRGPKLRSDLFFLNNTEEPAILIEVCFVDSEADAALYRENFDLICNAIAGAIAGEEQDERPDRPEEPATPPGVLFEASGTCSWFGGPEDTGVAPDEDLAFFYDIMDMPELFLPYQPSGTTGLARRLNPEVKYVACRWDYDVTPKEMLRTGKRALVRGVRSGIALTALPADWGPHEEETGRAADLSPSLMRDLQLTTDDEVEILYPWTG